MVVRVRKFARGLCQNCVTCPPKPRTAKRCADEYRRKATGRDDRVSSGAGKYPCHVCAICATCPHLSTCRDEHGADRRTRSRSDRDPHSGRRHGRARAVPSLVLRRLSKRTVYRRCRSAIARRPGWATVIFPTIPLGSNGANTIGGRFPFPGTYAVRPETLRAIFMDLGAEFGEQGFRWIFLIHMHGAPDHNQALDDAGEYFRDVYGGRMINLAGLDTGSDPGVEAMKANASKEAIAEEGIGGHAGLLETSRVMAARPDLVASSVASAPSVSARDLPELYRVAGRPGWPGYVGAPRHATPDLGRRIFEADTAGTRVDRAAPSRRRGRRAQDCSARCADGKSGCGEDP